MSGFIRAVPLSFLVIDVWGFDDNAVNALKNMKPVGLPDLVKKYGILLGESAADHSSMFEENITLDSQVIRSCSVLLGHCCDTLCPVHMLKLQLLM